MSSAKIKHAETELYEPVAEFLRQKGFKVRSEVKGLDVAAVKDDILVVVELKLSFNIKLLMQAVSRLRLTEYVYVAIPRPPISSKNGLRSQNYNDMLQILKRLEIGLLLVALDSPAKFVEPVLHPMAYTVKSSRIGRLGIIKEIDGRVGDFNKGGSTGTKITTAYREKSVQIACILLEKGTCSTKELRYLGITPRDLTLLQKNFYGWFERVETGVYKLTSEGEGALKSPDEHLEKVVNYYRFGKL